MGGSIPGANFGSLLGVAGNTNDLTSAGDTVGPGTFVPSLLDNIAEIIYKNTGPNAVEPEKPLPPIRQRVMGKRRIRLID